MNRHFRQSLSGLDCGCQRGGSVSRVESALGAAESAPMPDCQCAANDDHKRAVMSDLLLLASILTTVYALWKGKS